MFLVAFDSTIIATAVPQITDQFNSLNYVGWYGSAYLLTTSAFQTGIRQIIHIFPLKWVYFELGSLICAVTPNSPALILGRAIAGLGSAGVFSGVSSVVGPLMGGAVTTHSTWRWCFYINLPIGAIAMSVIAFFFEAVHRAVYLPWRERLEQFVIIGTVLFIPSIVCVLLAMQMGGTTYAWSSGRIIALFVIFGVTLIAFIAVQFWRPQYAALSPSVLGKRNAWASALFAFFMGTAYYAAVYYIPIWFQAKNVSANESGIRNIPLRLAVVFGTIASGAGVTIFGFYTPFMLVSMALASIGAGLLTTWDVDTGSGKWIGYQIVLGLGIGIGLQLPMVAIQTVLDASEIPIATALIIFCQLFGASIFVSVGDNAITNDLKEYIAENIPGVDAAQVALAGATNIASEIPSQYLPGLISAYNNAITTVFIIVIVMACSTIFGSAPMKWV
ncbi:hypothetical protein TCE0_033r09058, partial [Talaromyces pinophilus]